VGTSCVETVGGHSQLTLVNVSERFVQREFPWLSAMPSPVDAPRAVIAQCLSNADALNVSLAMRKFSAAKYASLLGVSPAFLSYLRRGERKIPEWIIEPLCSLTGTNLLRQWLELQAALRAVRRQPTDSERIETIARQLRGAA
jgi:plasmid maintenance system antidote protein VapI